MRSAMAFLLSVVILAGVSSSADAAAKKKKKGAADVNGDFAGTVVSVTKSEGSSSPASITVKLPGAKKKAPATERKFELTSTAKLETVTVAKKGFGLKAASLDDMKTGERVVIQTKEGSGQAERVLRFDSGKKPKAAAAN